MQISFPIFFLFIFTSYFSNLCAQVEIKGIVLDKNNIPIDQANVIIFDSQKEIITYGFTSEKGEFLLGFEENNNQELTITANSLGFEESEIILKILAEKSKYDISFRLENETVLLNEVVLKSTQKISSNGSVTTIQTAPFTDETEQTVEEVLEKLPGIEVLDNGSIKAHGKFIDKLLIDGEDLFANNYQILSKNLDAKVLGSVQILDNFQDNPVLKKVLSSDAVALNLQLKEEFKNIWFGNVLTALGTEERTTTSVSIGLLRKKIKFFYFGDYSNLGNKASDQMGNSFSSININSVYQEKQIEPELNTVYSVDKNENLLFKNGQSTFNKALLNSVGFITKLMPDVEIRGTGSFTKDNQNQLFSAETIFNVEENPVRIFERSDTDHINTIATGELELKYTGGEKSYLKNLFVYRNQPEVFENNLLSNNMDNVFQKLDKKEYSFYNHLNYSYVLNKSNVVHNYLYLGKNQIQQEAFIQSPILSNLISSDDSDIYNISKDELKIYGINSNLFSSFGKIKNRLEIGYESQDNNHQNRFIIDSLDNLQEIDSLQNNLVFRQSKISLKDQLTISISEKFKLSLGISVKQVKIDNGIQDKEDWLFNPEIGFDLKKLKIGRFRFGYENTYNLPNSYQFLRNYQLTNYRSFIRGREDIRFIKSDVFNLYYKWANNLESQAFTVLLRHSTSDGRYSTDNQIDQNFIFSSYRFFNGGEQFSGNLDLTSYYEQLKFSTNIGTTQKWSETPLIANSTNFSTLKNYFASYFFSGTTYFDLPINFTLKFNLNQSQSDFEGSVSTTQWENALLNMTYKLSTELSASVENDYYQMQNESYHFLGATIYYQPKDSDFTFQLKVNNLIDNDLFSSVIIDEFTSYNSNIELLPRYFLFSAKYRF
ncbi:TonB-dependent receptor [Aquimarina muelleri]|uniref:TonB-dependent receptor n=1 Tax=Aquimarina muelleri TaxID=279356 RepID=UPI003F6840A1